MFLKLILDKMGQSMLLNYLLRAYRTRCRILSAYKSCHPNCPGIVGELRNSYKLNTEILSLALSIYKKYIVHYQLYKQS